VSAGDDFDQSGFAGAVFAKERVNLARLQVERNTTESADSAEGFSDLCELEERVQFFIREFRELSRI
jgi:hypothetical protein